jgi:haloalkane dehalogenase
VDPESHAAESGIRVMARADRTDSSGFDADPYRRAMDATPLAKQYVTVDDKRMAYHDTGGDDPVLVFLHGNPTSSYLWRHIVRALDDRYRCVAPDLIGQGDSDKLDDSGPGSYRFVEHRRYLDGLLDQLDLGDEITFVIHDWGSALGFDWARRHPDRVAGIAYMEAIVRPVTWDEWPDAARGIFQGFRSGAGEEMVLDKNLFVEAVLPASIIRTLGPDEMAEYRRPFAEPGEGRRPTLTWPCEIPIEGEPADVTQIVQDYADWLSTSDLPKLFVNADPGAILIGDQREFCRAWPNQTEVTVSGNHFLQEDSPDEIAAAIATWRAGF